jgi:hypothetical protein
VVEQLLHSVLRAGLPGCVCLAVLLSGDRGEAQDFGYGRYVGGSYSAGSYGTGFYGGGGPDPNYFLPAPGTCPDVYSGYAWQTNPFAVGYDLLAGYRPIYGGARQPIGHEMIWTSQNGYVYRPTYSPNTSSSRIAWAGGPLVIDYPGTDRAKYYTASGRLWEAQPGEARPSMFTPNDVAPPIPLDEISPRPVPRSRGPREF